MIDIVYPIGNGSRWDNNELRYSLRSVQKYLSNVGRVHIVGELPDFIHAVNYIPFQDIHRWKETRIALKILKACQADYIGENFLFMNDDHFLLRPFDAEAFPYFMKETIATTAQNRRFNDAYRKSLVNSYMALTKNNFLTHNFDVHCPIIYNKKQFSAMMAMYDWDETNYSFIIKSMYCNTFGIPGVPCSDLKINNPLDHCQLTDIIRGREFFSIGDRAVNSDLLMLMENLYPEPSIYEKQSNL